MVLNLISKYKHINWALADQAVVSGVNFLTGLLIARLLGLKAFGIFNIVWMGVLFVNSIQLAMISSPMMSIGPKQEEVDQSRYYSAVITQQIIFSVVTFLLMIAGVSVAGHVNPEWGVEGLAMPLACAGFFFQNQDFIRRYFFSQNLSLDAFINDSLSYVTQIVILSILFFYFEAQLEHVLWVISFTSFVAVIFGMYKIKYRFFDLNSFFSIVNRHWRFSRWSALSALLQWFSTNTVFILSGMLLGATSVGVLKASQNLLAISHVLFQAMENILPRKSSKIYVSQGFEGLSKYKNMAVASGGVITLFLALIIGCFADNLLVAVYGDEYSAYKNVVQWFSVIYVFMFLGFPYRAVLRAIEDTKSIFFSQLVATAFVFCMGYPLIAVYELNGALVTLLAVYIIIAFFLHYSFSRKRLKGDDEVVLFSS